MGRLDHVGISEVDAVAVPILKMGETGGPGKPSSLPQVLGQLTALWSGGESRGKKEEVGWGQSSGLCLNWRGESFFFWLR